MITRNTLIPLGLVLSMCAVSFNAGKLSDKLAFVEEKVHAIELDRSIKMEKYGEFQREVLQRLSRIESAVTNKKEK